MPETHAVSCRKTQLFRRSRCVLSLFPPQLHLSPPVFSFLLGAADTWEIPCYTLTYLQNLF